MKGKLIAIVVATVAIIGFSNVMAYTYPEDVFNVSFSGHNGYFNYFCDFNKGWEMFTIEGNGDFGGYIYMNIGDFYYDHGAPLYEINCGWDDEGGWFNDVNGYTGLYHDMVGIQDIYLESQGEAGYYTTKEYYYGGTNVGNDFGMYTEDEYTGYVYNLRLNDDDTFSMYEMFEFSGIGDMSNGGSLRLGGVPGCHSSYMNLAGEFNGEGNFELFQYEFSANWGDPWATGIGQIDADEFHGFDWSFETGTVDMIFNWEDDEDVSWWFDLENQ